MICYCFVHQHGRLITWLKTIYTSIKYHGNLKVLIPKIQVAWQQAKVQLKNQISGHELNLRSA